MLPEFINPELINPRIPEMLPVPPPHPHQQLGLPSKIFCAKPVVQKTGAAFCQMLQGG